VRFRPNAELDHERIIHGGLLEKDTVRREFDRVLDPRSALELAVRRAGFDE